MKIYKSSDKFYNMNVMAVRMLTYSWSEFTVIMFFAMCVVAYIQTSINVFDPKESNPVNVVKIENWDK